MKIKNGVVLAVLWSFFICPVSMNSQALEDLLAVAADNNLELKMLEKEYLAAMEKAPQVSQMPDPEVGVAGFPLPVETRLGPQIVRLSATQMLPWSGLLDGKKDLELARAKALYERIGARKLELAYEVKQAWYRLYEIEQSGAIIRRNLVLLESLEELALARMESGKTTGADVLSVQLKVEELRQELAILEVSAAGPVATINQLLNRAPDTPVRIVDSLSFAVLPFNKGSLLSDIEASHPMLRMYELQQETSRKAISLNELNGKPSFGVGLDYIMVGDRSDADPSDNGRDILQVRASMKIPLYRKQYEAKELEESLRIEALEYQKADVLNRFAAAIEKAYAEHEAARLKMELYEKQKEITRAATRILESDYSTQGSDFGELLRLEKEWVDYDLKMLRAVVQSHVARSGIERFVLR